MNKCSCSISILLIAELFSLFLLSCKENIQKTNIDSEGIQTITLSSIKESFQDISYFKEPQIVVLETIEESFLSKITRIFMDDDILFIYDKQLNKIVMFDISGKYISKIDCKGKGPGEYVQITDFTIDTIKKQIIALCSAPEKLMYFTYDCVFIEEESYRDHYWRLTMDDHYIYFEEYDMPTKDYLLHILDTKTGEIQGRFEPLNIKNFFYTHGNSFTRGKDILFVRRYDNSIYELKNGEVIKKYDVDFKKYLFPEWFIKEEETEVIGRECSRHEYIFSMTNISDNDSYLMFYTNDVRVFIYDKKKDILTGYKQMLYSNWSYMDYTFSYYLPLENTHKIVYPIEDPSFIKHIADRISGNLDEVKKMSDINPEFIEEIITIGSKMKEDNNPVLFIYEFKE